MKDRLMRFMESEQVTSAKLADILDVQRSGLSHILSGRNKPSFDFIQKLMVKFPALNSDWLITGKGAMYKGDAPAPSIDTINTLFSSTLPEPEPESYRPENRVKEAETCNHTNKPVLRKIIMIYSDNSFVEYTPGKEQ